MWVDGLKVLVACRLPGPVLNVHARCGCCLVTVDGGIDAVQRHFCQGLLLLCLMVGHALNVLHVNNAVNLTLSCRTCCSMDMQN